MFPIGVTHFPTSSFSTTFSYTTLGLRVGFGFSLFWVPDQKKTEIKYTLYTASSCVVPWPHVSVLQPTSPLTGINLFSLSGRLNLKWLGLIVSIRYLFTSLLRRIVGLPGFNSLLSCLSVSYLLTPRCAISLSLW